MAQAYYKQTLTFKLTHVFIYDLLHGSKLVASFSTSCPACSMTVWHLSQLHPSSSEFSVWLFHLNLSCLAIGQAAFIINKWKEYIFIAHTKIIPQHPELSLDPKHTCSLNNTENSFQHKPQIFLQKPFESSDTFFRISHKDRCCCLFCLSPRSI